VAEDGSNRHPDISDGKHHPVWLELLVLGDGITWSAATETGHLRKGAGLREGRTLVGTHEYTSFRRHPAPPVSPVRVHDHSDPSTRRHIGQTSKGSVVVRRALGTFGRHGDARSRRSCSHRTTGTIVGGLAAGRSKLRGRPPRSETVTGSQSVLRRAGQPGDLTGSRGRELVVSWDAPGACVDPSSRTTETVAATASDRFATSDAEHKADTSARRRHLAPRCCGTAGCSCLRSVCR